MHQITCSVAACDQVAVAKGMCKPHYGQDYYQRTRERQRAQRRAWYELNAEAVKEKARAAYAQDPEKYRDRVRSFKERHPDYYAGYWSKHYARNRQRLLAEKRIYYLANRERVIARAAEWSAANPEARREIQRRWKKSERGRLSDLANAHARLARKRNAPGRATPEQLTARWDYYGGRCWMCFEPATEFDHVMPLSRGGSNWPSNLRPACSPCNLKKWAHIVHKEFPMAITSASFVPERRGAAAAASAGNGHGNSAAAHASSMHGEGYNHATDAAMSAMHESMPANHPVTGTALPKGTGAGKGTIRRGGRGGK